METRRSRWKRALSRFFEKHVVNRAVRAGARLGFLPDAYALLETRGRRSGLIRRIPVANGLRGDTFWLISAHGRHAHYVRNIDADPHVRIAVREGRKLRWRAGTAHPMPGDDALARQSELGRGRLGYRLDAVLLRALATDLTTIRVDLEPAAPARHNVD